MAKYTDKSVQNALKAVERGRARELLRSVEMWHASCPKGSEEYALSKAARVIVRKAVQDGTDAARALKMAGLVLPKSIKLGS